MSQIKVSVCGGGCKDISVPNTGFITNTNNYQNNSEGMIGIGFFVILLVVFGIITTIFLKKRSKHRVIMRSNGLSLLPRKKMAFKMFVLAILVVSASFVTFNQLKNQENESYADTVQYGDSLTVSASDVDLSVKIDNGEETAFGYATGEVKVSESTQFGYKLLAYVNDNRLVSEHGDFISSVESDTPTTLGMNNWGLATEAPLDQNSSVWYGVPTTLNDALVLKDTDYMTPENDITKVYYGVKINNELSCGDYNGTSINYVAIANVIPPDVKFEFRGEDTYFDEGKTQTSNVVGYANTCTKCKGYVSDEYVISQTDNVDASGSWNGESVPLKEDMVQIPGADKLAVEINYSLHDDVYLTMYKDMSGLPYVVKPDVFISEEGDRVERYLIDGDTAMIRMGTRGIVTDDDDINVTNGPTLNGGVQSLRGLRGGTYNYSYYAKVYPVYNDERAGTTYQDLPQVCGWMRVMGDYKKPVEVDGKTLFGWSSDYIDVIDQSINLESDLIEAVDAGIVNVDDLVIRFLERDGVGEALSGRTISYNSVWRPYYGVRYEGNGGVAKICKGRIIHKSHESSRKTAEVINCPEVVETTTLSQKLYLDSDEPYYLEDYDEDVLRHFYRDGYDLIGWSTDPNAIEPQYTYDDEFVLPENPQGQSITLYAVWGLDDGGDKADYDYMESLLDSLNK